MKLIEFVSGDFLKCQNQCTKLMYILLTNVLMSLLHPQLVEKNY